MFSPTHKHIETGDLYQFLFSTNEHCTRTGWDKMAVYVDHKNRKLSRPLIEFEERYIKI